MLDKQEERAKQLLEKESLTDEEQKELQYLIEETENRDTPKHYDPIKPIENFRKIQLENQRKKDQLELLRQERISLEVQANIRKEKEKIKKLKAYMDKPKKIWCDDCRKLVDPDHFN